MTETGHTPGPWEVRYEEGEGHVLLMGEAVNHTGSFRSHHKWTCDHCLFPDEETEACKAQFAQAEADAQLLAAAPDLLEACKAALKQMTNDWYGKPRIGMEKECAMCEAAIAKATKGNQ